MGYYRRASVLYDSQSHPGRCHTPLLDHIDGLFSFVSFWRIRVVSIDRLLHQWTVLDNALKMW